MFAWQYCDDPHPWLFIIFFNFSHLSDEYLKFETALSSFQVEQTLFVVFRYVVLQVNWSHPRQWQSFLDSQGLIFKENGPEEKEGQVIWASKKQINQLTKFLELKSPKKALTVGHFACGRWLLRAPDSWRPCWRRPSWILAARPQAVLSAGKMHELQLTALWLS